MKQFFREVLCDFYSWGLRGPSELKENGCVVLPERLTTDQVEWLRLESEKATGHEVNGIEHRRYIEPLDFSLTSGTKSIFGEKILVDLFNHVTPGRVGSGGGWHVDSFHPQLKIIVYLNDVTENNGAFEYLLGSHSRKKRQLIDRKIGVDWKQHFRLTEAQVEKVKTICAPTKCTGDVGTVLLANTVGIHRGSPFLKGERRAYTRYVYTKLPRFSPPKDHFIKYA